MIRQKTAFALLLAPVLCFAELSDGTFACSRCTIDIELNVDITIENSGNGSGNIGSNDNGSDTDKNNDSPDTTSKQ